MTAKKPEGQKVGAGRPTKYDPAFCERVINLMSEGLSLGACAGEIGVSRSTAELWEKEHPEFSGAVKVGRAKAQLYWERALQRVAQRGGGPGTATAVIFGLKNRSPDDWREKTETAITGQIAVTKVEWAIVDPQADDSQGV
jgi:transposase